MTQITAKVRGVLRHLVDAPFCKSGSDISRIGSTGSGWVIKTSEINTDSIVYSAGVGKDISFETELVERFGCRVELFDPSPTGVATAQAILPQSDRITFHAVAWAGKTGELVLGVPFNPAEGSFTVANTGSESITVPCTRVSDWMKKQGHSRLDILKMDIEGSEYEVVQDILNNNLDIGLLCCEFHHFLPGYRRVDTLKALWGLHRRGYEILHKQRGDYTLWRASKK
jgi:FkbM family methyltransferase